jgi:hypothetical protein
MTTPQAAPEPTVRTELEDRIADLESRLDDMARLRRLETRPLRVLRHLVPVEARNHLRAARREELLAARSLLDHWIERLEREPKSESRRETIELE